MNTNLSKAVIRLLENNPRVSGYKLNTCSKESFELFYVKGRLETVRCTDTCDRSVTVYVDHDGFRGDSQFYVYPSTTEAEIQTLLDGAIRNALLIENPSYTLPGPETGDFTVPGNLNETPKEALAQQIARAVFAANTLEGGSLNSV